MSLTIYQPEAPKSEPSTKPAKTKRNSVTRDRKKGWVEEYMSLHPRAKPETFVRNSPWPTTLGEVVGLIAEIDAEKLNKSVRQSLAVYRQPTVMIVARYHNNGVEVTAEYVEQVRADLIAELSKPFDPTDEIKRLLTQFPKWKPKYLVRWLAFDGIEVTADEILTVKAKLKTK